MSTYTRHAARRRIRIRKVRLAAVLAATGALAGAVGYQLQGGGNATGASLTDVIRAERHEVVPSGVWPVHGQAAFMTSDGTGIHTGPNQHPAPIASVAKVMTANLVLRDHPLRPELPSRRKPPRDAPCGCGSGGAPRVACTCSCRDSRRRRVARASAVFDMRAKRRPI
jgi:hypothetical protein